MPEYEWNQKLGRYRDVQSKKIVSRANVLKQLDEKNTLTRNYMQSQAHRLVDGQISLSQFQTLMIDELKRSHLQMGLLASGGKDGTSKRNYGAIGNRLKQEYEYLNNFVAAIGRGELTDTRLIYRAGLYANSSNSAFFKSEQISRIENGATLAKRELDPNAQHCPDCPALSTNGKFLPIDRVAPPTRDCVCRSRCRCTITYKTTGSRAYSLTSESLLDRLVS